MFFCPSCNCEARIFFGAVVEPLKRHIHYSEVVCCVNGCSFVSEIANGQLIDAAALTLRDLEEPLEPSPFMILGQAGPLIGRES